jgi:TonB family protein
MPDLPDLSPESAIKLANKAHPAFKYAIVVAGLIGIVVVVTRWGVSAQTAVFGTVILVVLMVVFLVFAQAASLNKAAMSLPAQLLVWSFLLVIIASVILLFTSAFFDAPLPLKTLILKGVSGPGGGGDNPIPTNTAAATDTGTATDTNAKPSETSGSAPTRPDATYNSDFPYGIYIGQMQNRIGDRWLRPKGTFTPAKFSFVVERDGAIREVKVLTSSGDADFDHDAREAILTAAPLNPLPFAYPRPLRVELTFK